MRLQKGTLRRERRQHQCETYIQCASASHDIPLTAFSDILRMTSKLEKRVRADVKRRWGREGGREGGREPGEERGEWVWGGDMYMVME